MEEKSKVVMTEQQLITLKKNIDSAKRQQSEMEGKRKALMENLKQQFGCSSIEQAEKKLASLAKEVEKLQQEKDKLVEKLEQDYEF